MAQETAQQHQGKNPDGGQPSQGRPVPDWSTLSFSLTETDVMYRAVGDIRNNPVWGEDEYLPFGDIQVSPAAAFMSYGLGVFEGLKAQKTADGRILLFRPDANAERLQRSAERLTMAPFPTDRFVEACHEIVRRNRRFVPPLEHGSFYLRPTEHAIEPQLGLRPCSVFAVHIFASPVGSYFKGAPQAVKLRVLEQGRCAPGGTGYAKAMGNYAGAIWVADAWKNKGYDDVLYLDAHHIRYLTETSGSNPFVLLRSGTLVTPKLDSQILPGITRGSTVEIASKILGIPVEERDLSIEEVIEEGVECFCTGTAWTLLSVGQIDHGDRTKTFEQFDLRNELYSILRGIQIGEREDPFGWIQEVE